jgi:hypothetical protein
MLNILNIVPFALLRCNSEQEIACLADPGRIECAAVGDAFAAAA